MLIFTGLTGAGKTSILKLVAKRKPNVRIVSFGDIITSIALKRKLVRSRDEISNLPGLPVAVHIKLQNEAVRALKDAPKTILDTHAILHRQPKGFIVGISSALLKRIKVDGVVFIDAPSDEIIARRKADVTRKRPIPSKEELDTDRDLSMAVLSYISARTGAPLYIIVNRQGKLGKAAGELGAILDAMGW